MRKSKASLALELALDKCQRKVKRLTPKKKKVELKTHRSPLHEAVEREERVERAHRESQPVVYLSPGQKDSMSGIRVELDDRTRATVLFAETKDGKRTGYIFVKKDDGRTKKIGIMEVLAWNIAKRRKVVLA